MYKELTQIVQEEHGSFKSLEAPARAWIWVKVAMEALAGILTLALVLALVYVMFWVLADLRMMGG